MPDYRYRNCRGCGRPSSEVGPLSWTRLCADCGPARAAANQRQLVNHSGPYFDHWRRGCLAAFGIGVFGELAAPVQTERNHA